MLNLDTHVLLHAFAGTLTKREFSLLEDEEWSISAIVIWEITKLTQLKKITLDVKTPELCRLFSSIQIWPIDLSVCTNTLNLDFKGDPADEIIAATSITHNIKLVTRDKLILKSKVVPLANK